MSYIVAVETISDGCTYSCEDTFPVKASCVEEAFVAFDDALKAAQSKGARTFLLWGREFLTQNRNGPPAFMTFEEWCAAGTQE